MPEQSPEAQSRPKSKARLVERPLSRRRRRRPYWRKRKPMLSSPPNKTSPVKVQFQFYPFVFILVVRRVVVTLSSWQRGHHVGGLDFLEFSRYISSESSLRAFHMWQETFTFDVYYYLKFVMRIFFVKKHKCFCWVLTKRILMLDNSYFKFVFLQLLQFSYLIFVFAML